MSRRRGTLDLEVSLDGVPVGTIFRDRAGRATFKPDEAWLARNQSPQLSVSFLERPEPRCARNGLPLWFENLLPEAGTPLRTRICDQSGIRAGDGAKLLRLLGDDLPGAARVVGHADDVELVNGGPAKTPRLRFSLAGVQLKFSVVGRDDRYCLPVANDDGRFILKVGGEPHPELAEVEAATMTWARRAGFNVPEFEVLPPGATLDIPVPQGSGNLFLIRRFDRLDGGLRVHQEDFAQALEVPPEAKYGDHHEHRFSYDTLGRFVRDVAGDKEGQEFVRRVAFAIASGNTDAHMKNWSFWWPDKAARRPQLAPNYDLVSTIAWPAYGWESARAPSLALGFGRRRTLVDLDRTRVETFCRRTDVPNAKACFFEAIERFRAAWPGLVVPERMRIALATHWQRVPLLKAYGPLPMM